MKSYPSLSKTDRMFMELIWEKGDISNAEILNEFSELNLTRHYVKTYLTRLKNSGFIGVKQLGPKIFRYFPLVSKEEFLADETSKYLKSNYSDLSYMVAGLVKSERVSKDEIDRLEQFIKEYKEK